MNNTMIHYTDVEINQVLLKLEETAVSIYQKPGDVRSHSLLKKDHLYNPQIPTWNSKLVQSGTNLDLGHPVGDSPLIRD